MANKNKATHSGTCQGCGATQKLPGGVLSQHGYDVKYGFFNGICMGAGHKPFEQATDLIERCIANAQAHVAEIDAKIETLSAPATEEKCWGRVYLRGLGKSMWQEIDLYERQQTSPDGTFTWSTYWHIEAGKLSKVNTYTAKNILEVATEGNRAYVQNELKPRAAGLRQYIKWQQDRVANWQPAELKPLAK